MKRKQRSKPTDTKSTEIVPVSEFPPFFERDEGRFVAQRVFNAGQNKTERTVFTAILRRAYEDALELEVLYREVPGVLIGDLQSTRNFRDVLNRAARNGIRIERVDWGERSRPSSILTPLPFGGFPCDQGFFIKPPKIAVIAEGIRRIARGDEVTIQNYAAVVRGLWRRTRPLERIYQLATFGVERDGRDRLAEYLAITARDVETSGRLQEAESRDLPDTGGILNGVLREWIEPAIPDRDGFWPPPSGGPRIAWPPDDYPTPPFPPDSCEMLRDACLEIALENGHGSQDIYTPLPDSTYATGITEISPRGACGGENIKILGSGFGASQPAEVEILIGFFPAEVVSWSDTEIVVKVPDGARSGCVGFLDKNAETERLSIWQRNQRVLSRRMLAWKCLGGGDGFVIPILSPSAPCTGFNFFEGTIPEVIYFNINGEGYLRIQTPTILTLTWKIRGAEKVALRRTSSSGPFVDGIFPAEHTITVGGFGGPQGAVAEYELVALNQCGEVRRKVKAVYGVFPDLRIAGIEVTQAIQRFDQTNASATDNNSVRLVAGKRTIVRVYVDSGLRRPSSPTDEQPNVTGRLVCWTISGESTEEYRTASPFNRGGVVTARPIEKTDRNDLCHTLNFHLPITSSTSPRQFRIEVHVWVEGHEDAPSPSRWNACKSTTVYCHGTREQIVVRILVQDDHLGLPAPTLSQYGACLEGARIRFPIAEIGFVEHILAGYETYVTNRDLTTDDGWEDLLNDIYRIASECVDQDEIWTALIPDDTRYNPINGIATDEAAYPCFVSRADKPATFAHEMGHAFGIGHADCDIPVDKKDTVDDRLPTHTEEIGIDVFRLQVIPAGTAEIMSYCRPNWFGFTSCGAAYPRATRQDRWPSIAFWDILFEELT